MDQANLDGKQAAEARLPGSPKPLSRVRRYGLAFLAVSLATGVSLILNLEGFASGHAEITPFIFALAITGWYSGRGPAILALVLSCFAFDFFFTQPRYTLYISSADIPYFIIFALFGGLVIWFSTVRRRTERELLTARDDLEKRSAELAASNKELEAFAYSVSHDLRAPLRHMAGFSELLQKNSAQALDEKSKRYIGVILESAKRMGALIDDLLSFSRIGRAETNKIAVNLGQLVEEALSEVRRDLGDRKIVWKVDRLPAAYGDRAMLRMALVNLISNAAKFTRTRTPAEIEIGQMPAPVDQVVIFVRDNGVGFDMKYVGKLFGVFQRLHSGEALEGTGIGLATVQRIAHRHGGRAWAEGAVDQGATFYLSISKSKQINL
jgi:signal transduction histidine kinase